MKEDGGGGGVKLIVAWGNIQFSAFSDSPADTWKMQLHLMMYWSIAKNCPSPTPSSKPPAFDFFEKIWSNSRYVGSLDGQMLHWLALQRVSNPPPTSDCTRIF